MAVFLPYHPLALLAEPEPPLPPPMTMKSYCFGEGAISILEVERCLDTLVRREAGEEGDRDEGFSLGNLVCDVAKRVECLLNARTDCCREGRQEPEDISEHKRKGCTASTGFLNSMKSHEHSNSVLVMMQFSTQCDLLAYPICISGAAQGICMQVDEEYSSPTQAWVVAASL